MTHRALLVLAVLVTLISNRAAAAEWTVRVEGGATDYSRQSFSGGTLSHSQLTLDGGYALSVAGEYHFNPRVGVELSLSRIALDAEWKDFEVVGVGNPPRPVDVLRESDSGDFSVQPLGLSLLFHPLRTSRSDLYVGPQVARVSYDVGLDGPPDRGPEPAFGAKLGWEWHPAASPWGVGLVYRFLDVQHEGLERDTYTGLPLHVLFLVVSRRLGK